MIWQKGRVATFLFWRQAWDYTGHKAILETFQFGAVVLVSEMLLNMY